MIVIDFMTAYKILASFIFQLTLFLYDLSYVETYNHNSGKSVNYFSAIMKDAKFTSPKLYIRPMTA